jgi:hypothetical protein
VSYPSYDTTTNTNAKDQESSSEIPTPPTTLYSQQSIKLKIEAGLFTNPLISNSDLAIGEPYDPEIINNIDRVTPNSDRWFCYNCTLRDDKWGMMKHLCRHNKRKAKNTEKEKKN